MMDEHGPDLRPEGDRGSGGAAGAGTFDRDGLDRSLASGVAWTGAVKWAGQVVSWITTLIVARLLAPDDFGIMGMATLVLGFIELVNEFGVGAAIVQRKDIHEELISHLGAFSLALGGGFLLLGFLLAGPVALFFAEPRVDAVVMVLSANFVISSVAVIPRSLLTRDMKFRALALIDGGKGLLTSALTIVLALMGYGYWALVVGSIVSSLSAASAYVVLRPFRPRWPRRIADISRELEFGWNVVASRVAWYAYSNADFAVVGRALGTTALGAYNIGWTLASLPVEKISVLIMRVTPPVFAKVQDRPEELSRYLRLLTEAISVVTFPIGVGMALVAPDFVPLVLGEQWADAVIPLQLLALLGGFRSVTPFYSQILVATDNARLSMWFSLLAAVFLIPGFMIGARWGTAGVALTWIALYPLLVVAFHVPTTFRLIELPFGRYLRSLWPASSSCMVMAGVVVALQWTLPPVGGGWLVLLLSVIGGAVAYAASLLVLHRKRVRASWRLLRTLRRNR